MTWVFLSPHFDDAVLSCGGLIWEKIQTGDSVQVWTICAGEIPDGGISPFAEQLHERWGTGRDAIAARREEDIRACHRIGADFVHLPVPDCIYRKNPMTYRTSDRTINPLHETQNVFLYSTQESIFGRIHPLDQRLIEDLADKIHTGRPSGAHLVCPLAVGNHVDHQLTRRVAETTGLPICYYADFPYILDDPGFPERLKNLGWQESLHHVSMDGLRAWYESIAAYQSQISTFWHDLDELQDVLSSYLEKNGGISLWKPPG